MPIKATCEICAEATMLVDKVHEAAKILDDRAIIYCLSCDVALCDDCAVDNHCPICHKERTKC